MSSAQIANAQSSPLRNPITTSREFYIPSTPQLDAHGFESAMDEALQNTRGSVNTAQRVQVPVIQSMEKMETTGVSTAVIKIWEGVVKSFDEENGDLNVTLHDRTGALADHQATINVQSIHSQDKDLIKPGAVFYWTLYRETKRGTIKTIQEIQFRRLPNWTQTQLSQVYADAADLWSTFTQPENFNYLAED